MTATEQVREALAIRMSSYPLIQSQPVCQVTRIDSVRNLLTRREFVAADRRFSGEPLTGFGGLA